MTNLKICFGFPKQLLFVKVEFTLTCGATLFRDKDTREKGRG